MSQLQNNCNMPDVGGVKSEFARLDVVIVPNGRPSRGTRGAHMFAL
jgi:hypothetical protein